MLQSKHKSQPRALAGNAFQHRLGFKKPILVRSESAHRLCQCSPVHSSSTFLFLEIKPFGSSLALVLKWAVVHSNVYKFSTVVAGNVRWSSSTSQIIILLVSTTLYITCLLLLKFYFIAMLHDAFPCSSLPSALQSSMRTSELSLSSPVLQYLGCTELCQWGTRCAAVGQNVGFWQLAEQCSWIVLCGLSLWIESGDWKDVLQ